MSDKKITPCPSCGYSIDSHSVIDKEESKPRENDLSICFKCTTLCRFDEDLNLVLVTEEEKSRINPETTLLLRNVVTHIKNQQKDLEKLN